jgi:alkaline phosphatase D
MVSATAASDHALRVVVTGLAADTFYYYRFTAGADVASGRTRTAPAATADLPIRLAWVSCQDYAAGKYHGYRQMIAEDMARAEADQIRFVLHLGDWIYETRGDGFQAALDDDFNPISVENDDGTPRVIPAFPSGGGTAGGSNFANTLEDYRHLYKIVGTDPDLQAARARAGRSSTPGTITSSPTTAGSPRPTTPTPTRPTRPRSAGASRPARRGSSSCRSSSPARPA